MRTCALLALLLFTTPGIWAQCEPAPAVKTALDALPTQTPTETEWQFNQRYDQAIQAVRARFPNDAFVEKVYVEHAFRKADKDKVIAEYQARHEKNPNDPIVSYLYGITLEGRQSQDAIQLFDAVLAADPQFPWTHIELVDIYSMPVFLNKEESLKHAKAFLAACPDTLDGYRELTNFDDKAMLASYAAKLRTLLEPRTDKDAISAYQTLWTIEFKAHSAAEYPALRKLVAADLKRLRALNREDLPAWYYALEEGYKLAGDQKQSDWARDERQQRLPESWELASMDKWNKDHPRPNNDDPADKKRAYYADVLKQTDSWLKERPKMSNIWQTRLGAMEYLDDVPGAEVIAAADNLLKFAEEEAGPVGPNSYVYFTAAQVLCRKHLQPERVVDLAEKGLSKLKIESADPMWDGYATKENLQANNFWRSVNAINPTGYEVASFVELKQASQAHAALTRMEDALETVKSLTGDKADYKKAYTIRLAFWWELMARTAELEGHDQDAMAFYEHALLSRFEAKAPPETGLKDDMADGARQLWTKLGGSREGWQLWYGRQADTLATQATLAWEDANQPLPAFELTDVKGKPWTQASMKGKTTFLNFWASW
jgi:hypothetical protein